MKYVSYQAKTQLFQLHTKHTQRAFYCDPAKRLIQLYYGARGMSEEALLLCESRQAYSSFSPVPELEGGLENSPDNLAQLFPGFDCGDYRLSGAIIRDASGAAATDFRYRSHNIYPGCVVPEGLPGANRGKNTETLEITLSDQTRPVECVLYFTVFPESDTITEFTVIRNCGTEAVQIERITSAVLDLPGDEWDQLSLSGTYAEEFQLRRQALHHGLQIQRSLRGSTGHQANPATALLTRDATETQGAVYGAALLYSGNFSVEIECSQYHATRLALGIADTDFRWLLNPGESLSAPETAFTFSGNGIGGMSRNFHNFFRHSVMPEAWEKRPRPLLCNSWEAMRFDFDRDRLLKLADAAAAQGVELLVLDDGWFGERNEADSSLGDWFVNTKKVGSLATLSDELAQRGLGFGLWFEPEMISRKSRLFEEHPEWVLGVPGHDLCIGRNQLVLDMTRSEVVDYLFGCMSRLIQEARLTYIKWDMNRNLTEAYSRALPPIRQSEVRHRYLLGVYALHTRLLKSFPELLIEGCSGGGGRFDGGMLHYCAQLWCSDNTDAEARLAIQFGESTFYPPCAAGSHVASNYPGKTHSFAMRRAVAAFGTFGYEMKLDELTPEEQKAAMAYNLDYRHTHGKLVQTGDFYRLTAGDGSGNPVAWLQVSPDRKLARLTAVMRKNFAGSIKLRLQGLSETLTYRVGDKNISGAKLLRNPFAITFDGAVGGEAKIVDFTAEG